MVEDYVWVTVYNIELASLYFAEEETFSLLLWVSVRYVDCI